MQDVPAFSPTGPVLVFGGPYGNRQATAAVLAAATARGIPASHVVCTGDLGAYCAEPDAVVDLIRAAGIRVVQGNCDERLGADAADCACGFAAGSTCERLSEAWFAHSARVLSAEQKRWLAGLPRRLDLDWGRVRLAVLHGAPSRNNRFVFASTSERIKRRELDLAGVDGVVVGHGGLPYTQVVKGRLWHDAGAIGMPANDGTASTWYSVLEMQPAGLVISHCRLDYEVTGAARAMSEAGLPDDYRLALASGLWPSCDVLPVSEIRRRGVALQAGAVTWRLPVAGKAPARARSALLWPAAADAVPRLAAAKFQDPHVTAGGEPRAHVTLKRLETLWINTGTLCNVTCRNCYIESSPRNDRLAYMGPGDLSPYLDEIARDNLGTREIGFTGGEPFMNPDIIAMIELCLSRRFDVLVLTNAMAPLKRRRVDVARLAHAWGRSFGIRVSLDHYTPERHEDERGADTFAPTLEGLKWLASSGCALSVAGRSMWGEDEAQARAGYADLFAREGIVVDVDDPAALVLFPEMDACADVPEITTRCWSLLGKSPDSVMCASSRMVVKRKGAARASVVACTLLPYDQQFELGATLATAKPTVALNHPHCARFCVLGGASCAPHALKPEAGAAPSALPQLDTV